MGRKKRQEFHMFLEKTEDQEGMKACVHIPKSINLNRLKPKHNPKRQQKRLGILDSPATEDKEQPWVCLKCAQLDCGRQQHTENRPANLHIISFNMHTKTVWCNVCNINVASKDNQKVIKALQYLQQHLQDNHEDGSAKVEGIIFYEPQEEKGKEKNDLKGAVKFSVLTPRGLKNLGNTCYFNVVLQCLARTPNLISQMEKLKEERITTLEANMLKDYSEKMPEVRLKLDEWMHFSDLLLKSLAELNIPESKPYVPFKLLDELVRVSNTITKDEQHDAHELLREVLQKIKEVDLQEFKTAIAENFKTNTVNKERVDDTADQMIKSYESHTIQKSILEEIFGGVLVNILICQECKRTSCTNEPFLDLSLSIIDKKITSSKMNVNKSTNTNLKKKHGSQQQKKNHRATINKDISLKNEETDYTEADVVDSYEQDARNSQNEESDDDQESHKHPVKSPLSTGNPILSIANNENILHYSDAFTEINMSCAEGAETKGAEHKDVIKNLNCNGVNATQGVSGERIMRAVEGDDSKDNGHKECVNNLAVSSPCCDSTSCSKNVDVLPVISEGKSESIMITAEATETKYQKNEDYTQYFGVSSPSSKTAGMMAATSSVNSHYIMNTGKVAESLDKEHEKSEKNLAVTASSLSSLWHESMESPLSDRDTPSPVSSEMNIDCSISIHMHAGCSSPVPPDCSGYRPESRFAFCDDVDSAARSSSVSEISSMSLKEVNELSSKSSNQTVSPTKLISIDNSCNDVEILECNGESSSCPVVTNEHSDVNLNQKEILDSVKKLNLSNDSLSSCIPLNYTNAKGMSTELKQKRRKEQFCITPVQDKIPEYDASRFTLECCLENFTALELMTDCEKVVCSHCSEKNGKGGIIFTTTTKQLQIRSIPAVLILHLKRFEIKVDGDSKRIKNTRPKKLSRHIQFPVELDISPYVYNENKGTQNLMPKQKENLYSLYAVIEHSGSLNRGHYIVYIKIKAAKTDSSYFKDVNENEYETHGGMSIPDKWFSISDESVQQVDIKDVLKSQAYILFYEKC